MPGIIGGVVFFVFIKSLSNLVYHSACMFLLFLLVSCPLQHHHSSSKLDEIPSDVKIVYENNRYLCRVLVRQDVRFPVMLIRRRDISALLPEEPLLENTVCILRSLTFSASLFARHIIIFEYEILNMLVFQIQK